MPAVHSFFATSADTPAFAANSPLNTANATLHAPTTTPRPSRRSIAMSSASSTPGAVLRYGLRIAVSLVAGSLILSDSPILYFFHTESWSAIGIAK